MTKTSIHPLSTAYHGPGGGGSRIFPGIPRPDEIYISSLQLVLMKGLPRYRICPKHGFRVDLVLHMSHVSSSSTCLRQGGPRLKCSELLRHIMEVLQSPYSCVAYGEDYSSLLVKDMLSVRKYWCDVTTQQWQGEWATVNPN